jgi:hypothetical protein
MGVAAAEPACIGNATAASAIDMRQSTVNLLCGA